jgi:O-antigen/teichoic acid export membrane protein
MSFRSTEALRWGDTYAWLRRERLLTHNLIVGGGTIAAGLLGIAFQVLVSHRLSPIDYGGVFAVVTLITFMGLPASALTLLMARETSRDRARGSRADSAALLHAGNRALLLVGLALAAIFVLASPLLASVFTIPITLLWAAAAGMPFGLALPLLLGAFQGEQQFLSFALLATSQAGLKLFAALALAIVYGPLGIIAGISLATVLIYLVARWKLRRKLSIKPRLPWIRPAATYLAMVVPSMVALAVLLSADVLVVKHFFAAQVAGEYAAVAAIGRAIFWGATAVATVLFPKVIFSESQGRSGSSIISASLGLVGLGGLAGFGLLLFGSTWLLTAFAGGAYAEAAVYLPSYAVGMTLLGGVAVLIATHQSRARPGFLAVLLPLTLLEPGLLLAFHGSVTQVVQVMDISIAAIVIALGAMYGWQEYFRVGVNPDVETLGTRSSPIAQPQVNR